MNSNSKGMDCNNSTISKINEIVPRIIGDQKSEINLNVSQTFNIKSRGNSEEIKNIIKRNSGFRPYNINTLQNLEENYTIKSLKEISRAFIKQVPQISEIFGSEIENIYKIYNYHEYKGKKKPDKAQKLFKCIETSTNCQRQCCSPACREFTLDINSYHTIDSKKILKSFIKILRPFTCNTICDRPSMILYYTGPGVKDTLCGDFVSGIIHNYKCNQIKFSIFLNFPLQNLPDCYISASTCEKGVFFNTPC